MKAFKTLIVSAIGLVAVTGVAYKAFLSLPTPIPKTGQVLNIITGKPIPNATLNARWRLYDYPMLDGAGSYELTSVTVTDAAGRFSLIIPNHRRGIWNTETCPPTITAIGYKPFTFDDGSGARYDGEFVTVHLTPE